MPESLTPEEQLRLIEELEKGTTPTRSVAPEQDVLDILPAQDFMPDDTVPEDLLKPIDIPKAKTGPDYAVDPITTQNAVSIPAEVPAVEVDPYEAYFAENPYLAELDVGFQRYLSSLSSNEQGRFESLSDADFQDLYRQYYTAEGTRQELPDALSEEQLAAIDAYNTAVEGSLYDSSDRKSVLGRTGTTNSFTQNDLKKITGQDERKDFDDFFGDFEDDNKRDAKYRGLSNNAKERAMMSDAQVAYQAYLEDYNARTLDFDVDGFKEEYAAANPDASRTDINTAAAKAAIDAYNAQAASRAGLAPEQISAYEAAAAEKARLENAELNTYAIDRAILNSKRGIDNVDEINENYLWAETGRPARPRFDEAAAATAKVSLFLRQCRAIRNCFGRRGLVAG